MHLHPSCCGMFSYNIHAKWVSCKVTRLSERGGSLLCSGCQGWPLGVSQLWRRSLYHIKGASKEPLQQHFGPAWKNKTCFDWSATYHCHCSADQQLAPALAMLALRLSEIHPHYCSCTHEFTNINMEYKCAHINIYTYFNHHLWEAATKIQGNTGGTGNSVIGFDRSISQIKHTSIKNALEGVRETEKKLRFWDSSGSSYIIIYVYNPQGWADVSAKLHFQYNVAQHFHINEYVQF